MIKLSNIEALIISKLESKMPEADVTPGTHAFDFTVRVTGACTRSVDGEKTPTSRGLTMETLALFIKRSGLQREAALEILVGAMKDSVELDKSTKEALLQVSGVAEAKERLDLEMAKLPKTKVRGALKIKNLSVVSVPNATEIIGDSFAPHAEQADAVEDPAITEISVD